MSSFYNSCHVELFDWISLFEYGNYLRNFFDWISMFECVISMFENYTCLMHQIVTIYLRYIIEYGSHYYYWPMPVLIVELIVILIILEAAN